MKKKNWSISLESDEYQNNVELVIEDAIDAVKQTACGCYVNLVTPPNFGNTEYYLTDLLMSRFAGYITVQFIDQCGCGGYVLRVWKSSAGELRSMKQHLVK